MARRLSVREVFRQAVSRRIMVVTAAGVLAAFVGMAQVSRFRAAQEADLAELIEQQQAARALLAGGTAQRSPADAARAGQATDGETVKIIEQTLLRQGLTVLTVRANRRAEDGWTAVTIEVECEGPLRAVGEFLYGLRTDVPQSVVGAFSVSSRATRPQSVAFRCTIIQRLRATIAA